MKQAVVIFSILLLGVAGVSAQQKITGVRYGSHHSFNRDTDTSVTRFGSDGWAAFKIKSKNNKPEEDRVGFIDTSGLMVIKPNIRIVAFSEETTRLCEVSPMSEDTASLTELGK